MQGKFDEIIICGRFCHFFFGNRANMQKLLGYKKTV